MSCPICGKPTVHDARPFCSKRCADVDLARWFNGSYAVASTEQDYEQIEQAIDEAANNPFPRKPH